MFLPSVENRRYVAVETLQGEGVLAGEHSRVETNLYKFSTSLPRYKVGKFSRVLITGSPEIAAVLLGDFSQLTIANSSKHSKDFVAVQGQDCCDVIITNSITEQDDMNTPAFIHADFELSKPQVDTSPLYSGFRLIGDSFLARIKTSGMYDTKHLSMYLYSYKGDLSLYMEDKHVFTLKAGVFFNLDFGYYPYGRKRLALEDALYKQLRRRFFECQKRQENNKNCKSVVA